MLSKNAGLYRFLCVLWVLVTMVPRTIIVKDKTILQIRPRFSACNRVVLKWVHHFCREKAISCP